MEQLTGLITLRIADMLESRTIVKTYTTANSIAETSTKLTLVPIKEQLALKI